MPPELEALIQEYLNEPTLPQSALARIADYIEDHPHHAATIMVAMLRYPALFLKPILKENLTVQLNWGDGTYGRSLKLTIRFDGDYIDSHYLEAPE